MCDYSFTQNTFHRTKVLIGLQNYEKYLSNNTKNTFIKKKIKKNRPIQSSSLERSQCTNSKPKPAGCSNGKAIQHKPSLNGLNLNTDIDSRAAAKNL